MGENADKMLNDSRLRGQRAIYATKSIESDMMS